MRQLFIYKRMASMCVFVKPCVCTTLNTGGTWLRKRSYAMCMHTCCIHMDDMRPKRINCSDSARGSRHSTFSITDSLVQRLYSVACRFSCAANRKRAQNQYKVLYNRSGLYCLFGVGSVRCVSGFWFCCLGRVRWKVLFYIECFIHVKCCVKRDPFENKIKTICVASNLVFHC